ncbi:MAG: AtpZ/AtpI family protein [Microscillaceae bacterium]|nr:AtpZ/AtpI family protein [Microscillaceae bacterium]
MKKTPPNKNKAFEQSGQYARYSGIAFQMIALIGLGVWGGISLDGFLRLRFPWFTVIFSLLACIGAMLSLIRSLPKY